MPCLSLIILGSSRPNSFKCGKSYKNSLFIFQISLLIYFSLFINHYINNKTTLDYID